MYLSIKHCIPYFTAPVYSISAPHYCQYTCLIVTCKASTVTIPTMSSVFTFSYTHFQLIGTLIFEENCTLQGASCWSQCLRNDPVSQNAPSISIVSWPYDKLRHSVQFWRFFHTVPRFFFSRVFNGSFCN